MNVFYDESGAFKVAAVLSELDAALHAETPHGKRVKLKASHVLLRFDAPPLGEFMTAAQAMADAIDLDFLWQCCGAEEFGFEALGREYFGRVPDAVEAAGLLLRLHAAPMYFYKKGRGRYKAAPTEALKAALASTERKRLQELQKQEWVAALSAARMPEALQSQRAQLLYAPDKACLEWKALDAACAALRLTPPQLFERCGAITDAHAYHHDRFLFERGAVPDHESDQIFDAAPETACAKLPLAVMPAFSIDDAATTEIDDAFSVAALPAGGLRVGIHISAPALGIGIGTALDAYARARLSTVYFPGGKITMLPEPAIAAYTLAAGMRRPAVSLYVETDSAGAIVQTYSRVEHVFIAANLRTDDLNPVFSAPALAAGVIGHEYGVALQLLWQFVCGLEAARGVREDAESRPEYSFHVDHGRVRIERRMRGTPIDKIVSELMIFANATWGRELADAGAAALYRTQVQGLTRMTTAPAPHQGLGVAQYAWSSSPLRRYIDLVNQRQLLALLEGAPAPYHADAVLDALLRDFDAAYESYGEFQRNMERYWCLRWLQQENIMHAQGIVLRENLVRLDDLPLVIRVAGLNAAAGDPVRLELSKINLWDLTLHADAQPS